MQLVLSKRYKVIKIIVCLLLCLTVMTGTFYIQTQECYAILPAIVLAPEAITAIGGILASLGICFLGKSALDVIVNKYMNAIQAQTNVMQAYKDMLENVKKLEDGRSVVDVPDDVYTSAKTFVDDNFTAGENQTYTNSNIVTVTYKGQEYVAMTGYSYVGGWNPPRMAVTNTYFLNYGTYEKIDNDTFELKYNDSLGKYELYRNNVVVEQFVPLNGYSPFLTMFISGTDFLLTCVEGPKDNYIYTYVNKYTVSNTDVNKDVTYNGDATKIDNPAYDYKTADGTRQIELKSSPADLVNLNGNDLINPKTGELTKPSHWVGKITDAMPGDYTFTGAGTISGLMDVNRVGTWDGTWYKTNTGAWTFEGTYTDAQSLTWEGVATQELEAEQDIDVPFNPPSMVLPAPILRKFPFCIPWDFYNSFKTLLSPAQAPKWTIEFPKVYFVGGGTVEIDFNQFSTWAAIVRWAILVLFNVGLIFATRKLIWK